MRKIYGDSNRPKVVTLTHEARVKLAEAFCGFDAKLYQVVYDFKPRNLYYPGVWVGGGHDRHEDIVHGGLVVNARFRCCPSQGLYMLKQIEERIGCKIIND